MTRRFLPTGTRRWAELASSYRRPTFSNKRSDGWCAATISSSSAVRDPVANGVSEPAFLGAVPNAVIFRCRLRRTLFSTLPLCPSLVSREIRRAGIPQGIKFNGSRSSLLLRESSGMCVIVRMLVSISGRGSSPASRAVPKWSTHWFRCDSPHHSRQLRCGRIQRCDGRSWGSTLRRERRRHGRTALFHRQQGTCSSDGFGTAGPLDKMSKALCYVFLLHLPNMVGSLAARTMTR
jgi:hypothetical protein